MKRLGGVFGDISEARPYFEDFVVRHGPLPDTLSGQRGYLRTFLTETRENIFRNLLDRETPDRASAIEQKYRSLFRGYQTLFLERVFDSYRADPTNITTPKIDQTAARTFRELSKLEPSKPLRSAVESSQKKIDLAVERVRSEFESDPSFLKRLDEELARKSDEEKIRLASLLNNRMVFDDLELFARFVQRKRS